MRQEIMLSGFGGQGLVLGGIILAEAAVVYDGKNATHNQSYGPEARGGACRSEVIISDQDIKYPEIQNPDLFLAMTQDAVNKIGNRIKPTGVAIVDPEFVRDLTPLAAAKAVYQVPITQIAREVTGRTITGNMVALGVISTLTGVVGKEAIEAAIMERVPPQTREMNKKALYAGFAAGEEAKKQLP
ncbi:MAG: 2-oxoacid:acceptor oxidoreductase family protein [bacterium]|jgi:2-oxoglutarate ferredoxin oxidoreductase subunit gamma